MVRLTSKVRYGAEFIGPILEMVLLQNLGLFYTMLYHHGDIACRELSVPIPPQLPVKPPLTQSGQMTGVTREGWVDSVTRHRPLG